MAVMFNSRGTKVSLEFVLTREQIDRAASEGMAKASVSADVFALLSRFAWPKWRLTGSKSESDDLLQALCQHQDIGYLAALFEKLFATNPDATHVFHVEVFERIETGTVSVLLCVEICGPMAPKVRQESNDSLALVRRFRLPTR